MARRKKSFIKSNKIILFPLFCLFLLMIVLILTYEKKPSLTESNTNSVSENTDKTNNDKENTDNKKDEGPTTYPLDADEEDETMLPNSDVINTNDDIIFRVRVNTQTNTVTIFTRDDSGAYTIPYKAMITSVGKADIPDHETPLGSYDTVGKIGWCRMVDWTYGQYAYRIIDSILFHSTPIGLDLIYNSGELPVPREYGKGRIEVEEFNKLGSSASLGCVRLTVADAKWIYDNCPVGTTVDFVSEPTDPLKKPEMIKIPENIPAECGEWVTYKIPKDFSNPKSGEYIEKKIQVAWDPTDPDPNNPWNKYSPIIESPMILTVNQNGTCADLIANNPLLKGFDTCGNLVTERILISNFYKLDSVDKKFTQKGEYANLTLTLTDALGRRVTKEGITLIVK